MCERLRGEVTVWEEWAGVSVREEVGRVVNVGGGER